jgi:hypothetical protein
MATKAQVSANQLNSQLSTGPKTEAGKAASAQNNFRHGLVAGAAFRVLPTEDQSEFDRLLAALRDEHNPATTTEAILVEGMAQAHSKRLASTRKPAKSPMKSNSPSTCATDLLKLRAEKRKEQIGFERQQGDVRKQEKHDMKKERQKWDILLAEAKVDHQQLRAMDQSRA